MGHVEGSNGLSVELILGDYLGHNLRFGGLTLRVIQQRWSQSRNSLLLFNGGVGFGTNTTTTNEFIRNRFG